MEFRSHEYKIPADSRSFVQSSHACTVRVLAINQIVAMNRDVRWDTEETVDPVRGIESTDVSELFHGLPSTCDNGLVIGNTFYI